MALTSLIFLLLLSVPVFVERTPEWKAQAAARRLARELGRLKVQAATKQKAFRIHFTEGTPNFVVEVSGSCADSSGWRVERSGQIAELSSRPGFGLRMLRSAEASELGLARVIDQFCYDPLTGSSVADGSSNLAAFAVVPAKDLTTGRTDRAGTVLLSGPSAEVAFE